MKSMSVDCYHQAEFQFFCKPASSKIIFAPKSACLVLSPWFKSFPVEVIRVSAQSQSSIEAYRARRIGRRIKKERATESSTSLTQDEPALVVRTPIEPVVSTAPQSATKKVCDVKSLQNYDDSMPPNWSTRRLLEEKLSHNPSPTKTMEPPAKGVWLRYTSSESQTKRSCHVLPLPVAGWEWNFERKQWICLLSKMDFLKRPRADDSVKAVKLCRSENRIEKTAEKRKKVHVADAKARYAGYVSGLLAKMGLGD